jgi:plastocyanin
MAPSPGPMTVDPARLKSVLGIADVTFIPGRSSLAIVDATLSGEAPAFDAAMHDSMRARRQARTTAPLGPNEIAIDNFAFSPTPRTVTRGTTVTWINHDDVPHLVASADGRFTSSKILDTDGRYSVKLIGGGTYKYFCALHPKMQGSITVR